jgi:outer membrane protein insertion porin family
MFQRVNLEASLFGDVRYLRSNYQIQQYIPFTSKISLGLNAEFGWGKGLGTRPYPLFKNFYGGGLGSVRVFEQSSLGVIDPTGAFIGGSRKLNVNAELFLPVPGTGADKTLRVFAFVDAGNVWREGEPIEANSLRASAGVGLSWLSPVGPLKLSYGTPVQYQPNDRIQRFQFQIGTAF